MASNTWSEALFPATRRSRSKAQARRRLAEADAQLADALPLTYVDALAATSERAVEAAGEEAERISEVTGEKLPSEQELAAIRWANLRRSFAERRRLLADALGVADVAELLGVGKQTPHDRAKAGTLLAVKDNGRLLFPPWQFDPDGPDGVVAGLPETLAAMGGPISQVGKVRWFLTRNRQLGMTPLEALRAGAIDAVVAEAETIGIS